MPRDNMASLIQRVARQARLTFRAPGGGGNGPRFAENLQSLEQLLEKVRAEDLGLAPPRGPSSSSVCGAAQPPASYMHICETERFSMGVFLLRAGAAIPLHDHPGMHGLLKVLYGTLRIAALDALADGAAGDAGEGGSGGGGGNGSGASSPSASPLRPGRRRRALLRSQQLYTPASPPCRLSPHSGNLHRIDAVGGPAAFLDILAPPYDPDHGRDCHYYRLADGHSLGPDGGEDDAQPQALPKEVWLQETPQAPDFWCGAEPYPGPRVSP